MRNWEYLKGLTSGELGMVAAVFIYQALSCMIQVRKNGGAKLFWLLAAGRYVL